MDKPNIILVNPSSALDGKKNEAIFYPNTAVLLLGTILCKEGFGVKIIDGNLQSLRASIDSIFASVNDRTLFVGFSVTTLTVTWCYKVAEAVKKRFPHVFIVWGGVHPTLYPEQTIQDKNVDVVVSNEACSSVTMLARAIEQRKGLNKVPGIYFKEGERIVHTGQYIPDDIAQIPPIDFSLIDVERYSRRNIASLPYHNLNVKPEDLITMPILTGIGCVYKCNFCINVLLGRKYRSRTAAEIVERIEYLQEAYNANFFWFYDEDFFISKKRIFEFIDLVERKNLKFYFRPWLRVSYFKEGYISLDVAKRLEKIGMVTAVMGAECGSQAMLDKIQKQIKVEDTVRAAEILSKTNIIPRFSFMVGLPGETRQDMLATYKLALRLKAMDRRSAAIVLSFAAYPGSPLYKEALEQYNLREPGSLAEWLKIDFSGFFGFYKTQGKPWIIDKGLFDRMNRLYNLHLYFETKRGAIYKALCAVLLNVTRLRFGAQFFMFPIEDYILRAYMNARTRVKNRQVLRSGFGEDRILRKRNYCKTHAGAA